METLADSNSSERLAEHVFGGSLAIQVFLIAVTGIVATEYEKVAAISDFEPRFRWFLWALVGLSVIACVLSLLSVYSMKTGRKPGAFSLLLLCILIVGIACATGGIVLLTIL
jgi:hypothetical protein